MIAADVNNNSQKKLSEKAAEIAYLFQSRGIAYAGPRRIGRRLGGAASVATQSR